MSTRVAGAALLILVSMIGGASAKNGKDSETIKIEVVSSKTKVHGTTPNVFSYTDVMFARVDGKNVIFVCDQRGSTCPIMQNGKTYDANRVGDSIFISMNLPDDKKPTVIKYKQTGSW
jgi:hypothetical protein